MGTSMGGQQSLCAAGLHPKVTAMLINVPPARTRTAPRTAARSVTRSGTSNDPQVLETAQYFDTVNCARAHQGAVAGGDGFHRHGDAAGGHLGRVQPDPGPEGSRADDRIASQPPRDARAVEAVDRSARPTGCARSSPGGRRIEPADVADAAHRRELAQGARAAAREAHAPDRSTCTSSATRSRAAGARATRSTPEFLANWKQNFTGWNAADFGWGADKTQHMLWRLQNGELDGVNPKVVVLMAGTNNVGNATPLGDADARARGRGARRARRSCAKSASARRARPSIVTGITPRNDNIDVMPIINAANRADRAARRRQDRTLHKHQRAARGHATGNLCPGMAHDGLHLTARGVPDLGRRAETGFHGDSRATRRPWTGAAADGRSRARHRTDAAKTP